MGMEREKQARIPEQGDPLLLARKIRRVSLCLTAAILLAAGVGLRIDYQSHIDTAGREAEAVAALCSQTANQVLDVVDRLLSEQAERAAQGRLGADPLGFLARMQVQAPVVRRLFVLSPDGRVLDDVLREPQFLALNLADRHYFQVHLTNPAAGLYIGEPFISRLAKIPLIPLSRAVRSASGELLAVVAATLDARQFSELILSAAGPRRAGLLVRADGAVLCLHPFDASRLGARVRGLPAPEGDSATAVAETERSGLDGSARIEAAARVGNRPLFAAVSTPRDLAVETFRPDLNVALSIGLSLVLLNLGFAALLERQARRMARETLARREAEAELAESEERYRSLYRDSPTMLCSLDAEARFLDANETWLATLGVSREEVLGKSLLDFLDEDSRRQAVDELLPRLERVGRIDNTPCRMVCREGRPCDVMLSAVAERGRSARTLVAARDVTARLRAERETKSVARFPEENPNPVLRLQRDMTVSYANKPGRSLLDHMGGGVGRPFPAPHALAAAKALESGQLAEFEAEARGRIFTLTAAPIVQEGYVNVYGMDITERRRAERERDLIFAHSLDLLCVADFDGRFRQVNPACGQVLGFAPEEMRGRLWVE